MTQKTNQLSEELSQYGYELFRPVKQLSPEHVLSDLLKQDQMRMLEGFSVVLTNVLRQHAKLDWESPSWDPKKELSEKYLNRLAYFLAFTYYLLKFFHLPKALSQRVRALLDKLEKNDSVLKSVTKAFDKAAHVDVGSKQFSTQRLKDHFENYVVHGKLTALPKEVQQKKEELELELLLSQFFTPRQKDLLYKREQGNKLTKTEREYFSRVLKKRLQALANDNLHALAKKLL